MSSRDRDNLLTLLQGQVGADVAASKAGWDTQTDVCSWEGIKCDGSSVVEVRLEGLALEGTLPGAVGQVSSLKRIYLSTNKFSGPFPSEIASLPNLVELDVSRNQLEGALPLPSSPNLEVLKLGHNKFNGFMSDRIGTLYSKIRVINIQYNLVQGGIPSRLGDLSSLTELDLSNNLFQGTIPTQLGKLLQLESLFLSNNRIVGPIPVALAHADLAKLNEIFLHGNLLTGTVPAALADLPDLSILFIDDNKLTGTIPLALCGRNLNEPFFHNNAVDVDSTYSDLYEPSDRKKQRKKQRSLQRLNDPTKERDGCTSIACPVGYRSIREDKDGVFPCEECDHDFLNPYLGANTCYDINNDHILFALWNATNGPEWTGSGASTWADQSIAACEKTGVTCNGNGEVTGIELSNMGLSGTLPDDLGFLRYMETLNLSNNKITGRIPSELRYAPLDTLDVANNMMTGLVPLPLCQKLGLNGNGKEGIFTCDTIACRVGYFNSVGHADEGVGGEKCFPCMTGTHLGATACWVPQVTTSGMGVAGEIILALLILSTAYGLWFLFQKSRKARMEILQNDFEKDELNGDASMREAMEVKVKDEWSSVKESTKEVWLDVPKIH